MADAMVTARMSQSKKDAGNRALEQLGKTASGVINELYDYIISTGALPFPSTRETTSVDSSALKEALAFVDSIPLIEPDGFELLSSDEIKRKKLLAKGRATKEELA